MLRKRQPEAVGKSTRFGHVFDVQEPDHLALPDASTRLSAAATALRSADCYALRSLPVSFPKWAGKHPHVGSEAVECDALRLACRRWITNRKTARIDLRRYSLA